MSNWEWGFGLAEMGLLTLQCSEALQAGSMAMAWPGEE